MAFYKRVYLLSAKGFQTERLSIRPQENFGETSLFWCDPNLLKEYARDKEWSDWTKIFRCNIRQTLHRAIV